jgi:hypothetical protein
MKINVKHKRQMRYTVPVYKKKRHFMWRDCGGSYVMGFESKFTKKKKKKPLHKE